MNSFRETIVAVATAEQNAGIGIIRLSGTDAAFILQKIFKKSSGADFLVMPARKLHFGKIVAADGTLLDEAMAVLMPAPHSFTGEDVAEIHCHGNVHLLRSVLRLILSFAPDVAVRAAEAGEFTKRAFLNGKLDLAQAEAVQELIQSQSESALRANLANLDGALSRKIMALRQMLLQSLCLVEASFEFPEEDIPLYEESAIKNLLFQVKSELEELLSAYQTSKLYDQGVKVAIVGRPNVGKSSLLNALLLQDRAIVTDIAGTTRDVVEGSKILNGLRFIFQDTAGLRATQDAVEIVGIEKSYAVAREADLILQLSDDAHNQDNAFPTANVLQVLSKADRWDEQNLKDLSPFFDIAISTQNRYNLTTLENLIVARVQQQSVQNYVHINERQRKKIVDSHNIVQKILQNWQNLCVVELLAEELRDLVQNLDEITGKITSDDVLGEIFMQFCIGK